MEENKIKKYSKRIALIKINDVIYSRDIHIISVVNAILLTEKIDMGIKDKVFNMLRCMLDENGINYEIDSNSFIFKIKEEHWYDIILKKNGVFVSKHIYDYIFDQGLEDYIYNIKLESLNETNIRNLELSSNFFVLVDDYKIDDIKLLKMNKIEFEDKWVFKESDLKNVLMEHGTSVNKNIELSTLLYIITGNIDDIKELLILAQSNPIYSEYFKRIYVHTYIVQNNKYNMSNTKRYEEDPLAPQFGILNLFDDELISKININKVM